MANEQQILVGLVGDFEASDAEVTAFTTAEELPPTTGLLFRMADVDKPLWLPKTEHAAVETQIIKELRANERPIAFDITTEPNRLKIEKLRVPRVVRVRSLEEPTGDGDTAVTLQPSMVTHTLKRTNPRHGELRQRLEAARDDGRYVLVTEEIDLSQILDVAPVTPGISPFPRCRTQPVPEQPKSEAVVRSESTPRTVAEAQALFVKMHERSCAVEVRGLCIPFMYALDGCNVRAHEMCERMRKDRVIPTIAAKAWLYPRPGGPKLLPPIGSIPRPLIPNGHDGRWVYHVAPLVRVEDDEENPWRVIDPALFRSNEPVPTLEQWKWRQEGADGDVGITEFAVYDQPVRGGEIRHDHYDPDLCYVPNAVAEFRAALRQQIDEFGPPPYRR